MGLPMWHSCQGRRCKRCRFIPWVGKIPLEEGMAAHSSVLAWRIPMDRGAWRAMVHRVTKSWTWLKQLSTQLVHNVVLLSGVEQSELVLHIHVSWGCPRWHSCKGYACQRRRCKSCSFNPWVRKTPWRKGWLLTAVNSRDREAWWATVHGVTKSQTQLSTVTYAHSLTHTYLLFSKILFPFRSLQSIE